jgi:glyoxylase-like metal-dependent hydrolase (beta-lactamase superfamily II)
VQGNGRHVLIDVGSGDTLGPETGWLAANLAAAHTEPADIDHVLLTHLHPDHAGGLISPDGQPVFPRATVHAARADAEHWFDPVEAAAAAGLQRFVYETAARVLAPYRDTGRPHRLPLRRGDETGAVLGRYRPQPRRAAATPIRVNSGCHG